MSDLSDLCASLGANEWGELSTTGIVAALCGLDGASGSLLGYSSKGVWDPVTQCAYHIGADHLASQGPQLVKMANASAAVFSRLTRPAWLSGLTFFHGYEHTAIDVVGRRIYHRERSSNDVWTWDFDDDPSTTWGSLTEETTFGGGSDEAIEFHPGMDRLLWPRIGGSASAGRLLKYESGAWASHATGLSMGPDGTYAFCDYNPFHDLCCFWNSDGDVMYTVNAAGTVTSRGTPPMDLYDGTGYIGVVTADPLSGDFMILSAGSASRTLYRWDPTTSITTAATQSSSNKPTLASTFVVGIPLSDHGCILYLTSVNSSTAAAWVYRQTAGPDNDGAIDEGAEAGIATSGLVSAHGVIG